MKKKGVFLVSTVLIFFGCQQKQPEEWLHLVLQVNTEDAIKIETDMEAYRFKELLKGNLIDYRAVVKDWDKTGRFTLQEFQSDKEDRIRELIEDNFKEWDYSFAGNNVSLAMTLNTISYLEDTCVSQTAEVIRKRLNLLGLKKAVIERDVVNSDRIIIEIPSLLMKNPERVKNIIKTRAFLEFRLVETGPAPDRMGLLQDYGGEVPDDMEVVSPRWEEGEYYLLSKAAIVTGKDLKSVRVSKNEWNTPVIQVDFNPEAARRLSRFTSDNLGKLLSIVFDGKVQMVATIQDTFSDRAVIHGNFTKEEAEDLVLVLRSGGLPAGTTYLVEKIIKTNHQTS
jgi:preprotein translocase subunit SecD